MPLPDYFITCFIRKDGQPREEYYYQTVFDAIEHFNLFEGDDSGLYDRIQVIDDRTGKILREMTFEGM